MDGTYLTPRACLVAACVALSLIAVAHISRSPNQSASQKRTDSSEAPRTRLNAPHRRAVESVYFGTKDEDDRYLLARERQQRTADVSSLSVRAAQLLRSHQQQEECRSIVVDLLFEVSLATTRLNHLQQGLSADPNSGGGASALSACFDTVVEAYNAVLLSLEAAFHRGVATKDYLRNAQQQLRDQRSSMEFLINNVSLHHLPLTPPREMDARIDSFRSSPQSGFANLPGTPTVQTPGLDDRTWIEPPPEYSPATTGNGSPVVSQHVEKIAEAPESKNRLPSEMRSAPDSDRLYEAVNQDRSGVVADLLSLGYDTSYRFGDLQRTVLHQAAHLNHVASLKVLLSRGAPMSAEDAAGDTALHLASWSGHVEAISILLAHGADVDWLSGRDGYSPLWCAISAHHIDAARRLLKHGARVGQRSMSGGGLLPLHQAAVTGQSAMCELLLERGAQVDCLDEDQNTPLHYAAASGSVPAVRVLLREGANIEAKQVHGLTAVHWAAHKGHVETLGFLLDYGASTNATALEGATPLHLAANRGHVSASRLLLDRGAQRRPGSATWDGVAGTPARMARVKGFADLARELKA